MSNVLVLLVAAVASAAASWPDCSSEIDGHFPYNGTAAAKGPYGPVLTYTDYWKGHPVVVMIPSGAEKFPLISFMHGVTGQLGMYQDNLENYATHGFVVVFPYIKDPQGDKSPLTTNTNGEFILRATAFANFSSTSNSSSPLYGKVDLSNIVLAGHSMGATDAITSALRITQGDPRVEHSSIKLVSTQHPGICGPFGPPPWPSTWMKADLLNVVTAFPTLFTTATNDGAFWPAPYTAEHEKGCFEGAIPTNATTHPATFVQFKESACLEDGVRPQYDDSGHDCPFKNGVESPWVLTAAKLYAQQGGSLTSKCATMLYGAGDDGLGKDGQVDTTIFRNQPKV